MRPFYMGMENAIVRHYPYFLDHRLRILKREGREENVGAGNLTPLSSTHKILQMADVFSKRKRSKVMAAIKSKQNKDTELKLISIFLANGIKGWRRNQKVLGKPDFVFRREHLVVFVDGCFWHGCVKHGRQPTSNSDYWFEKLNRNRQRDKIVSRKLRKAGWKVLRLWEHDLAQAGKAANRVKTILQKLKIKLNKR